LSLEIHLIEMYYVSILTDHNRRPRICSLAFFYYYPGEYMHSEQPYDVAVIGAGASGALLATQFSRQALPGARLALIGAGSRPARGVAYETPYLANLLNVPAGNMSAFPDDREHFIRWLASHLSGSDAGTFAPRLVYGEYLEGILAETLQGEAVELVDATAIDLTHTDDIWTVRLKNGSHITARSVVLAIGNALAPDAPLDISGIAPWYCGVPWATEAIQGLSHTAPVLLIGTGLTTVDVALSLRESGHEGPIHAVSRHGRLYHHHKPYSPQPLTKLPDDFRTPRGAVRWTSSAIKKLQEKGDDWRAVIDSLRPHTALIWSNWTLKQRGSFLRHARNLWDIHRHRMAPEVAGQLTELLDNGILTIHAGRLLKAEPNGAQASITIRSSLSSNTFTLDVDRVINCTGPSRNYSKTDIPLISRLRERSWLTPDRLKLGIETGTDGQLIDTDGGCIAGLYTIGPLRIPALFESIAIPEIRVQAEELAKLLAEGHH
jgi:uncharacterized NAD(P)/FAD-binding protein YdhS